MIGRCLVLVMAVGLIGCAASSVKPRHEVLATPPTAKPDTAKLMDEGRRLYDSRDWAGAEAQYEQAVKLQPTLPEAHYNLGIALYAQRKDGLARKHFVEAANLAPGDKVIWDAPVFRDVGFVDRPKRADTGTKVLPALGAH
jgi:Flp pilus assembly protein TadD